MNFICDLTNLEELRLRQNRILDLPSTMLDMVKLKILDISYNPIKSLPPSLTNLFKSLRLFEYYNSVLMPKEIRRDAKACLEFLELSQFLSRQVSDTKDIVLAVVGGSMSGKRSLVSALMDDKGICRYSSPTNTYLIMFSTPVCSFLFSFVHKNVDHYFYFEVASLVNFC